MVLLDLFPQAADVDRERIVVHEMPRPVPECLEDHTAGDDKPGVSYQHTEKPVFGGSEGQRFPAKEDPAGEQVNGHIAETRRDGLAMEVAFVEETSAEVEMEPAETDFEPEYSAGADARLLLSRAWIRERSSPRRNGLVI